MPSSRALASALLLVGLLLLSGPGLLVVDAHECRTTHSFHVEEGRPASTEPVPFESLSERQQEAFLEAHEEGTVRVSKEVELPYAVRYQNQTYTVYTAHGDACRALLFHPVFWLFVLGGFGCLALARRQYRKA